MSVPRIEEPIIMVSDSDGNPGMEITTNLVQDMVQDTLGRFFQEPYGQFLGTSSALSLAV